MSEPNPIAAAYLKMVMAPTQFPMETRDDIESPRCSALFFGPRWDSGRLDNALPTPTPLEENCMYCNEPILEGERGFVTPVLMSLGDEKNKPEFKVESMHMECDMAMTLSHSLGQCPCHVEHSSFREEARATLAEVDKLRAAQNLLPMCDPSFAEK